jgi:hypothetical protein
MVYFEEKNQGPKVKENFWGQALAEKTKQAKQKKEKRKR